MPIVEVVSFPETLAAEEETPSGCSLPHHAEINAFELEVESRSESPFRNFGIPDRDHVFLIDYAIAVLVAVFQISRFRGSSHFGLVIPVNDILLGIEETCRFVAEILSEPVSGTPQPASIIFRQQHLAQVNYLVSVEGSVCSEAQTHIATEDFLICSGQLEAPVIDNPGIDFRNDSGYTHATRTEYTCRNQAGCRNQNVVAPLVEDITYQTEIMEQTYLKAYIVLVRLFPGKFVVPDL